MTPAITAFVVGALVGAVFAFARSAPPAPASLPGILGVVGIFVGWYVTQRFRG